MRCGPGRNRHSRLLQYFALERPTALYGCRARLRPVPVHHAVPLLFHGPVTRVRACLPPRDPGSTAGAATAAWPIRHFPARSVRLCSARSIGSLKQARSIQLRRSGSRFQNVASTPASHRSAPSVRARPRASSCPRCGSLFAYRANDAAAEALRHRVGSERRPVPPASAHPCRMVWPGTDDYVEVSLDGQYPLQPAEQLARRLTPRHSTSLPSSRPSGAKARSRSGSSPTRTLYGTSSCCTASATDMSPWSIIFRTAASAGQLEEMLIEGWVALQHDRFLHRYG
jgi:hypothetical protein